MQGRLIDSNEKFNSLLPTGHRKNSLSGSSSEEGIHLYILLVHRAAALLVFLSASARAGVVRTYLCALADGASLFAAVGRAAGRGYLRHLLALGVLLVLGHYRHHQADGVLADGHGHLVEDIIALLPERNDGILLTVGAESYAALELFHGIDVIHPLAVNHLEQNHALERSHYRHAVFVNAHELFTLVINLMSALNELFLCVLAVKAVREVLGSGQPAEELLTQSGYVPVGVGERLRAVEIDGFRYALVEHLEYNGLEVLAVEHLGRAACR